MQSESQLRRRAAAQGLRLTKFSDCSRWHSQYGPYALTELDSGCFVAYGLDLDAVATELSRVSRVAG